MGDDDDDDETVFKEELIKFRLKNFYNVGLQQHVTGCQSIDSVDLTRGV
jgi:hypothetical protein